MEIEKPFKCPVCSSRFTNEDHLQVHRKRHEMSLNLNKSGLSLNNCPDGFVDETPTPTRFIRNCEEVGLFQDLQNVNPFDEQFTKAASATPSHESFEFNFSDSATKKLPDDTLNTPQVFGFTTTTSSSSMSTSLTVITSSLSSSSSIQNPGVSTTASPDDDSPTLEGCNKELPLSSNNSLSIACTAEDTQVESTTPDNESFIPPMFSIECKSPTMRLDLTPVTSSFTDSFSSEDISFSKLGDEDVHGIEIVGLEEDEGESYMSKDEFPPPRKIARKVECRKAELLERNRAAASRSRERRKQWVSGLETRCQTLQALLSTSQAEVAKLRLENNILREELGKHSSCDVTRNEPRARVAVPRTPEFQPQILKHSSSASTIRSTPSTTTTTSNSTSPSSVITISTAATSPPVSSVVSALMKPNNHPQNITVVPPKPKRGRPRKGCEKRAEGISIPTPASSTTSASMNTKVPLMPPKAAKGQVNVEILPVKTVDGQPLPNVYILKRGP